MLGNKFEDLCNRAEKGIDVLVDHNSTNESGHIMSCSLGEGRFQVETAEGKAYSWSFSECEEHTHEPYPSMDIWKGFPDEGYPHEG